MKNDEPKPIRPECPHCGRRFDSWHVAKLHVKYCPAGPNARKMRPFANEPLECVFCGSPEKDFAALAIHVKSVCPGRRSEAEVQSNIAREYAADAALARKRGTMNIKQYVQSGQGEMLPLIVAKPQSGKNQVSFKSLAHKGEVVGKMLACREINSKGKEGREPFHGLAMDFKATNGTKFAFLARFDRYDIPALAKQAGSEETDDWIGETFRFILRPGKRGGFVNVAFPKKGKK